MCFSASYAAPKTRRKIETPLKTRHKTDRNCPNYSISYIAEKTLEPKEVTQMAKKQQPTQQTSRKVAGQEEKRSWDTPSRPITPTPAGSVPPETPAQPPAQPTQPPAQPTPDPQSSTKKK